MRNRSKAVLLVLSLLVLMSCSTLVDATTYYSIDEGAHGGMYGSSTSHSTSEKEARISANAITTWVEGWAWLAVEVTLSSSEEVSMDSVADLTAYLETGFFGSTELRVCFRCIDPDTYAIEWTEEVWDYSMSGIDSYSWNDDRISDDFTLNNFPVSTPEGTWLFVVHYEFDGHSGALLQKSSSDSSKSILEVSSITVSY